MSAHVHWQLQAALAFVVLALAATAAAAQARPPLPQMAMNMRVGTSIDGAGSLRGRFNFLSHQTSNRCNLQAAEIERMPATARLQGSCCMPMVYASYVKQINGLKAYRHIDEIPPDPYNIAVPLAQRLITFNAQYHLTAPQQKIYDQAAKLADEHGPCCCRCWRWTAFQGQAKELIVRRRYTAQQIAEVWDVEDGCGGSGDSHGGMMGG
jgi:hypothetical protein